EETSAGALDFGWVTADAAVVYPGPQPRGKAVAKKVRFDRVAWREERAAPGGGGAMVRISEDGATPAEWMRARDLTHPSVTAPPGEIGSDATAHWLDVDLSTQTLVAYEGPRPRYATLVSTGRPPADTPVGVFRIWVKLWSSDMDNLAPEEEEENQEGERFSIEDVPYVQFFEHGVALHGAFWHRDFGRVHSHGCVNLAPKDAAWLFGFTAPHLPSGWDAVLPTALEPGTVVQVRAGQIATGRPPSRGAASGQVHSPVVSGGVE
ncbi:MAG TPA: L,D-transpeptidase, partial [Polyangiaceae bacterium]